MPTEVYEKDGKWYARINSLTNSTYSVIWNPVTVNSVENHWVKDTVNGLASRLIINNPETFAPDKAITRADFAGYIVRALGLYRTGFESENRFKDVQNSGDRNTGRLDAARYFFAANPQNMRFQTLYRFARLCNPHQSSMQRRDLWICLQSEGRPFFD
mgnify:FL=1